MSAEAISFFPDAISRITDGNQEQKTDNAQPCITPSEESLLQTNVSDDSLLIEVGEGSKDALSLLFTRHGRAVLNVAWRILRDDSEAADLRQEVFLYLFQRAKFFDPQKGSATSWIMQVTYHRAIDRRRYLTARQHYRVQELDEQSIQTTTGEPSTDNVDGKSILIDLRECLTTDQQRTLELHFFEGYSFREIADRSGQSVGNIRHHYYRALDRLRSNLFSKKRS